MTDWLTPEEWQAVALSLRVSLWATAVSLPFGILVAYALARWEFPGKFLLNGLVHLPLILPPVVTGYLLLLTFGRRGFVGQYLDEWFGIVLAFRWTGAALAAGIMAFPLMVRAIRLSVEAVDPKLEQAAGTLGASRPWVFLTVTLPLILPPVVTGYLLLITLGRRGSVGQFLDAWFGIVLSFRWTGAAVAAAVMAFPLMVRAIRLSIEAVDLRLEQAAGTLGAPRLWVFATVTLPMILPGVIAGAILAFAKAMGEFGATITFVSNIPGQTQTAPSAIYAFLQVPGGETAAGRLVLISVVIAMGALLLSEFVARRVARVVAGT